MRQQIRFFAIGLLTASLLIYGFYIITDETDAQMQQIPVETLIAEIESDGYRVITEEEFIDYSFYKEEINEKDNGEPQDVDEEENKNDEAAEEKGEADATDEEAAEEDEITRIILTVKPGDVSPNIAAVLKQNGLIEDENEFIQYLEDNNYSPYIQLGTFELTSDMSLKEIAETITTFPGN